MIDRVRDLRYADALAAAGLGLVAAGLVVTGDGLVSAAQRTPGSSVMSWNDRLLLGLWSFRLEHALWFTLGLVLLWAALAMDARVGGQADRVARLAGGVAIGFVLLAAAVVAGSTIVALAGSVGSGALEVTFSRNQRIFTWLLQLSSAAALSVTWLLAGTRLGERFALAPAATIAASVDEFDDLDDDPDDGLAELSAQPPPPPPPVPLRDPEPLPPAEVAVAAAAPATPAAAARRVFAERLAYSPKREDAKRLLDEIARAEREGRDQDVASLAAQIDAM
ncbi:MAG: hypothetical protein QOI17_44 [Gaiellales bacterium]|nr:hypothetical protein [Gaiellales bacterium]